MATTDSTLLYSAIGYVDSGYWQEDFLPPTLPPRTLMLDDLIRVSVVLGPSGVTAAVRAGLAAGSR